MPEERLDALAIVLFAGALGLLAGLAWAPLGIAAASGQTLYFAVAVGSHVRHRDLASVATPIALWLLAAVVLALRAAA